MSADNRDRTALTRSASLACTVFHKKTHFSFIIHSNDISLHEIFTSCIAKEILIQNISTKMAVAYKLACLNWCSGSLVTAVRALDSRPKGSRFNSRPMHYQVTTLGKLFTLTCLCRCK